MQLRSNSPRRRPIWQRSVVSRLSSFLLAALKKVTFARAVSAIVLFPILLYLGREVARDALVIDPLSVPKSYSERGLTSEIVADRIAESLREIEEKAKTRMKKENMEELRDESSIPEVEIPGTNLGLKAAVEIASDLFGRYPKHAGGDLVLSEGTPPNVSVTVYITQGRKRDTAVHFLAPAADPQAVAHAAAERILNQINPYILAVYRYDQGDDERAGEISQRIAADPSQDRQHRIGANILWGDILEKGGKHEEAIAKFQQALKEDSKEVTAIGNWAAALEAEGKYSEAVDKFQQAINLRPQSAQAEYRWLDHNQVATYHNWGLDLDTHGNIDEAIAKFRRATELDPSYAPAFTSWGIALQEQQNFPQAIDKYRKATELNPDDAAAFHNWATSLQALGRNTEAQQQFAKAQELLARKPVIAPPARTTNKP